ncbi:hypothetical protein M9H77_07355 [Catharanthus roseus]|uniref:Uncharacterized protein n=1 Tax=Catharanthus roseus TaxID=4058 RepID=A0ACC0BUR8_CATRO|nr:hypothetical protein M9H77_07355 [Catharanthus roseus]
MAQLWTSLPKTGDLSPGARYLPLFLPILSFFSPPPCACSTSLATVTTTTGRFSSEFNFQSYKRERSSASVEDIEWVKSQIEANGLDMSDNVLPKGINPRTWQQQLQDLLQFKGISHDEEEAKNHTALPCPGHNPHLYL